MKFRQLNPFRRRNTLIDTPLPGFDAAYYLRWYPDVGESGLDPLDHYLRRGWREGRDPSAGFCTLGYLAANPDVAAAGHNPLVHFVNVGFAEGRRGYAKAATSPAPPPSQHGAPLDGSGQSRFEAWLELRPGQAPKSRVMQGDVNDLNCELVTGWALGAVSANAPAELEVFVDRTLVGTIIADAYRPDMELEGFDHPYHGFRYDFLPPLNPFVDHVVTVRRAVDKLVIGQRSLPGHPFDPADRG